MEWIWHTPFSGHWSLSRQLQGFSLGGFSWTVRAPLMHNRADIVLWFTPKRMARSSWEKFCLSLHKVNIIAHPPGPVSFSFPLRSCPSKFDVSSSIMCWHDSFVESPTSNKNSIHSTSMPKVINSGGCSSLVYSKVCDFLVLFSSDFLVLLSDGSGPHEQHSTIVLHSTTFFSPPWDLHRQSESLLQTAWF